MSRRIITNQLQAGGAAQQGVDGFIEKLWKYIPSDVVAFYVFVAGLIDGAEMDNKQLIYWAVIVIGMVGAYFWTLRRAQLPNTKPAYKQAAVAVAAFLVWAFAIGGPFADYGWWNSILGAIVLAGFTLLIPLVNPD